MFKAGKPDVPNVHWWVETVGERVVLVASKGGRTINALVVGPKGISLVGDLGWLEDHIATESNKVKILTGDL